MAAIICGIGGVLLAIRAVRSKERQSASQELDQTTTLLDTERNARIDCETRSHLLAIELAKHGIPVPKLAIHPVELPHAETN
jgi:hypothetical protein